MPSAVIDGITTRYEVSGSDPPLLMYAPGGFNAIAETWSTLGIYGKIKLMDHLPKAFTCIMFDRRECRQSGGRVERVTWRHYVAQGERLLDHLKISALTSSAAAWAARRPRLSPSRISEMVASMIWPVGGAKYRISSHQRFAEHLGFVQSRGLEGVVAHVGKEGKPFGADPRGGPWASVIKRDPSFAVAFSEHDPHQYTKICEAMRDALFDRDTALSAEPEDLMRVNIPALVVPGHDAAHATSAARYLEECLPRAEYWDMLVERQTEDATNARVMDFLRKISA
jgi:hypothetical protein